MLEPLTVLLMAVLVTDRAAGATESVEEVRCALSIVSQHLNNSRPSAGRLHIVGNSGRLGPFLLRLPPVTVTLLSDNASMWPPPDLLYRDMEAARHLVMILADDFEDLLALSKYQDLIPTYSRALLWTFSSGPPSTGNLSRLATTWSCLLQVRVAVSCGDGVTRLYALSTKCGQEVTVDPLNEWSNGEWQRGTAVFSPHCWRWMPPDDGQRLQVFWPAFISDPAALAIWDAPVENVLREVERAARLRFERVRVDAFGTVEALKNLFDCRLDALAASMTINVEQRPGMVDFPLRLYTVIIVVPAGLGRHRSPFNGITGEFSTELWCATGTAACSVAMGFYCLMHSQFSKRTSSSAALLALAPLVQQPLPSKTTVRQLQRPLLGSWLAVCLVLSAAYQGQLLSDLSVARSVDEIDNLEDLVHSNLSIIVRPESYGSVKNLLPLHVHDRVVFDMHSPVAALIPPVAEWRNCALVLGEEALPVIRPWLVGGRLHTFAAPLRTIRTFFRTSKDSPFEAAIRKTLGRLCTSGIVALWMKRRYETFGGPSSQCPDELCVRVRGPAALDMRAMRPAVMAMAAGLLTACLTCLAETVLFQRLYQVPAGAKHGAIAFLRWRVRMRVLSDSPKLK
ncbi:uncharacterized protein LOC117639335 isoform X2 [Thrips palmi]|uniref:Uncharacterized protein LOC117639335 isoform X2 n=1 Tax=Thrips palmi TaxID=161013 RepID=A0A6P8Y390_THRPL|nr:uncharacterized protein LOC117639335 isoform X2 [Thrips palmi]